MSKVAITEQYLTDIADAIREKTGLTTTYKPSEMANAISSISGGGGIIPTGSITITENDTYNVTNYASAIVNVPTGSTINNQNKTATPTESSQIITYDSGYTGLEQVTISAIPNTYVGSSISRNSSSDLTVSDATVNVPSGYYSEDATASVASGTAGTPKATKGTVSNHAVSITPSVTNTTGYITGGTKNGTAVSVSASELVSGTLSVTSNGTKDVTNYASVNVNVPSSGQTIKNQDKTVTPSETKQTITYDDGYDYTGLGTVTVNAISSTYVGSDISRNDSTDLTASGATVSVPAGYYSAAASKSVTSGTATAPTSISVTAASVSTGTNTLTLTKTVSVTPTVTAGYVSSGTAGNSSVSLTASVTTKAAATITPTTSNQTIAAGTYLTGIQTIAGDADLVAANIKKNVNIFGVTGSYEPDDFIVTLTQDSNNNWVPDCTFAELAAAYSSGKNISYYAEYPAVATGSGSYNDFDNDIGYVVIEDFANGNSWGVVDKSYIFKSSGVTPDLTNTYYLTGTATAQPSDVISGKIFFNSSGYQTGTLDLIDVYIRSTAPTASVGNDGDIYIQA